MRVTLLSYMLDGATPTYGGLAQPPRLEATSSMATGDSADTYELQLGNHVGTHVDCPAHFHEGAPAVSDYVPESWLFRRVQVTDVRLKPGELLGPEAAKALDDDTDLLLFRSGWSTKRDEPAYGTDNPGISPELARRLREHPCLRAIGMDWISVSSFAHRAVGREVHRILLDPSGTGSPVRIVEDMRLPPDLAPPDLVLIAPLVVRGLDSAPCTVFALSGV